MNNYQKFHDDSPNEVPVRGFLHRSAGIKDDWLVLTHGAGSNCNAPLLVTLADGFCTSGLTVLRCHSGRTTAVFGACVPGRSFLRWEAGVYVGRR
jgi:hypothetical protein